MNDGENFLTKLPGASKYDLGLSFTCDANAVWTRENEQDGFSGALTCLDVELFPVWLHKALQAPKLGKAFVRASLFNGGLFM